MGKIGGIILAGGKSSRMGQNKAMMKIADKHLIEYVYDIINKFTNQIIISSNNDEYSFLSCKTVPDLYQNIGPVAGIFSCLKKAKYEKNIVMSCDTPFVSEKIIKEIIQKSSNYDVTIVRNGDFIEPLIGVYNKSIINIFEKAILEKNYSIRRVIKQSNINIIDLQEDNLVDFQKSFFNINNQKEFLKAINFKKSKK